MISQNQNKQKIGSSLNSGYLVLIFLIWPFIAFLLAFVYYKNKISNKIILAFFALYGMLFYLNPVMDGFRKAANLKIIAEQPFENIFNSFENLYEETLDFVEPIIIFTVSRFTDFHGVLFAVYALIFGSLMMFYINKMYGHYASNKSTNTLLFLVLLIFVNPIFNINGFRMWTAAWVYSIAVLCYLHKANYKYLLLSAFSFFIHFSFFPLVILFVIYTLLKNRPKIYMLFAIGTFFTSELNIGKVKEYAALFGTASEDKINAYTYDEYVETVNELSGNSAWYIDAINNGLKYFTLLTLLIIFFKTRGNFKTKLTANFYSFALLQLSFANISGLLPSGGRFYTVYYTFAFSAILLYYVYENTNKNMMHINKIGIPIVVLFVIFALRLFSDTASVYLFGPSFMMLFGIIENVSLQSVLF